MARYALWQKRQPSQALLDAVYEIEVEETTDSPGTFQLSTAPALEEGDLTLLDSHMFAPFAEIAVTVTVEGGEQVCLIDGYVIRHSTQLVDGVNGSTLTVSGEDTSVLMNQRVEPRTHDDKSDSQIAEGIFSEYGLTQQVEDTQAQHLANRHTLMQHTTDLKLLQSRAQRNGFVCYLRSGVEPGNVVGHFHRPRLDRAETRIVINVAGQSHLDGLSISWNVENRPTEASADQRNYEGDDEHEQTDTESGLRLLGRDDLATFSGRSSTVRLTTPAEEQGEQQARTQATLIEAGWFVSASGEVDADALGTVLRPDSVVEVMGAGSMHSGEYYVKRVRHMITPESYRMAFDLVRNAVR